MRKQDFEGVTIYVCHKGGNSQKQMNLADQQLQQQNNLMQQQLQMQQNQLGMVNPSLQSIIANQGMLPAQEAAMRSAAMAQTGAQEQQAIGAINQNLVARGITGGNMAGGGQIASNYAALQQGLLGQQAQNLQNLQLAKGQGLTNAIGLGLGEGQMYGGQALGFGQQAGSALGAGVQAGYNADQAQTGFWGSLIGGLAGLGGNAMTGAGAAGGFGKLFGG